VDADIYRLHDTTGDDLGLIGASRSDGSGGGCDETALTMDAAHERLL
jgi:hypothetical protein